MINNNLAIVGIFFDGYIDLWRDFFGLIRNNWGNCPYKIYIVNNEMELTSEDTCGLDVTVIHAGKNAEYSRKVQIALREIKEQYMLLLLEDFYITSKVSNNRIEQIMDIIKTNHIDYYTMPMPEFVDGREKEHYKKYSIYKISENREYILSCQPSIWKHEFLELCIGKKNYNAWIFEGIYAKSDCVRRKDFLEDKVVDYSNPFNFRHGAIQGKLVPKTIKIIEKSGYQMKTCRQLVPSKILIGYNIKRLGHRILKITGIRICRKFKVQSVLEQYEQEINNIAAQTINDTIVNEYVLNRRKEFE